MSRPVWDESADPTADVDDGDPYGFQIYEVLELHLPAFVNDEAWKARRREYARRSRERKRLALDAAAFAAWDRAYTEWLRGGWGPSPGQPPCAPPPGWKP